MVEGKADPSKWCVRAVADSAKLEVKQQKPFSVRATVTIPAGKDWPWYSNVMYRAYQADGHGKEWVQLQSGSDAALLGSQRRQHTGAHVNKSRHSEQQLLCAGHWKLAK